MDILEKLKTVFPKRKDHVSEALDNEIERVAEEMSTFKPQTDNYARCMSVMKELMNLKNGNKPVKEVRRIDPNTIVVVVGGLLEVVLIMNYERGHVITTKAFSRILRPRI